MITFFSLVSAENCIVVFIKILSQILELWLTEQKEKRKFLIRRGLKWGKECELNGNEWKEILGRASGGTLTFMEVEEFFKQQLLIV